MAESENKPKREEIFSKTVRAGKRTYFFDVKSTRAGEYYLTITESKRRFNNEQGKFYYEKHKVFLYREDFEKFSGGLKDVVDYILNEQPVEPKEDSQTQPEEEKTETKEEKVENPISTVEFEDLGKDEKKPDEDSPEEEKKPEE